MSSNNFRMLKPHSNRAMTWDQHFTQALDYEYLYIPRHTAQFYSCCYSYFENSWGSFLFLGFFAMCNAFLSFKQSYCFRSVSYTVSSFDKIFVPCIEQNISPKQLRCGIPEPPVPPPLSWPASAACPAQPADPTWATTPCCAARTRKLGLASGGSRCPAACGLGTFLLDLLYAKFLRTQKRYSCLRLAYVRSLPVLRMQKLNFLRTKENSWYSCLPCVREVWDCNALLYWAFTPTQKLAYRVEEHEWDLQPSDTTARFEFQ